MQYTILYIWHANVPDELLTTFASNTAVDDVLWIVLYRNLPNTNGAKTNPAQTACSQRRTNLVIFATDGICSQRTIFTSFGCPTNVNGEQRISLFLFFECVELE